MKNILIVIILAIVACSPKPQECFDENFLNSKSKSSKFVYYTIEGEEYFMKEVFLDQLDSCLISSPDCLKAKDEFTSMGINGRKVTFRNFAQIPMDDINEYEIQICVDPSGETIVSRMLSTKKPINDKRKALILKAAIAYRFEADLAANCLECGKLVIKINGNSYPHNSR